MPTDGHYAGQTAQGAPISFDLVANGSEVTNVVAVFTARAGGRAAVLTVTRRLPVDAHGEWEADVLGVGFHGRFGGRVGRNGAASGSLHVDPAGSIGWEARRVTDVLATTG